MPTLQVNNPTSKVKSHVSRSITEDKKRLIATSLVKFKGNQTDAFNSIYPNITDRAQLSCYASETLKSYPEIRRYAIEYMQQTEGLKVKDVIQAVKEDIHATKEVLDGKGRKVELKDNTARTEAIKTALRIYKLYDTAPDQAQQVSNNLTIVAEPTELKGILQELKAISQSIAQSNKEQTGEVIDITPVQT